MTQTQTAALDAAVMRAVSLASSVKAFAAAKEDALAACKANRESAPEGYSFRVAERVRETPVFAPEDMEKGADYVMVRAAKDAPQFAAVPVLALSPWQSYEFFSLAESNAKAAKDANAKRLLALLAESGQTEWKVDGYGKATVCGGKPKAKAGAVPVEVKRTPYQTEEVWTPYKRKEAEAHAEG